MKAPVIAVAFAAGLVAGPAACALAGDAPVLDTVPALESKQVRMVECAPSKSNPALASNASAILDTYLRFHADVRADATIAGLPGRRMTGGETSAPPEASCNSPAVKLKSSRSW